MASLKFTHVEVWLFRRRPSLRFLLLRRAPSRRALPGIWQPVTGHLIRGESALAAAKREVREETGLAPARWFRLESPALIFDPEADCVRVLPRFAAEIPTGAHVRLSPEHDAARYGSAREAARLVLWDTQREAIAALESQLFARPRHAAALEIHAPRRARRNR